MDQLQTDDLVTILVAVIAAVAGWMTQRARPRPARSDVQSSIIDDLQVERDKAWAQVAALEAKGAAMQEEMAAAIREARAVKEEAFRLQDVARLQISMAASYIWRLRAHIDAGQPPPSPDIPPELSELLSPKNP